MKRNNTILKTVLITSSLVACFASTLAQAQIDPTRPPLPGTWILSISGIDGCGFGTRLVQVDLTDDISRHVPITGWQHTSGCGDPAPTGFMFWFDTLDANGRGRASLT